jgi:hypothetical protein
MRRISALFIAASIGIGMTLVSAAPASAKSRVNTVHIDVSVRIIDDETFRDEKGTRKYSDTVLVGPTDPRAVVEGEGCVGQEVRVKSRFVIELAPDHPAGTIRVYRFGRLYEGRSCSTNDLDGWVSLEYLYIGPNKTHTGSYRVRNEQEGGDKATVSYTITNKL